MKPAYHVPSMDEIRATKPNGFRVASLFSGCGGSSLGYKMAGFEVVWANEFIPAAQETYRANHPDTILDTRDIREISAASMLSVEALGMKRGELDVLDGSPPCAAFSSAGSRDDGWNTTKTYSDSAQRVDDLFFEFARLLDGVQPRTFVAENVAGLVRGVAKGYFKLILAALEKCGYRVAARVLDAQWLGVPQHRERLIFVGVRNDLKLEPAHPSPLAYRYTVRDALPHVERVKLGGRPDNWVSSVRPSGTIVASDATTSPTAYFSCGGYVEVAGERRKFTIEELRRICGFPDDFALTGSFAQQWERLGRAVPPVMMKQIAETLRDKVLSCAV